MTWGIHRTGCSLFPGNTLELRRNVSSGIINGIYINGRKVHYKSHVDSRVIRKGFRYKFLHRLERASELLSDFGIGSLFKSLSTYYLTKDIKNKVKELTKANISDDHDIKQRYAKHIEYRDLNNFKFSENSFIDLLEAKLRIRDDLVYTEDLNDNNNRKQVLDQEINDLKIKVICNSICNHQHYWEGIDGNCRKEMAMYIMGESSDECAGAVVGSFITKRLEAGKIVFTIREFDNVDNENCINFRITGEISMPINNNYKYCKSKDIAMQLANPDFIRFLHLAFDKREEDGKSKFLDLNNQLDLFHYLSVYRTIRQENIDNKDFDDSFKQVSYLLVDRKILDTNKLK